MSPQEHDAQKAMVLAAERLSPSHTERTTTYPLAKPKEKS